jgi:hypothetical protein
MTGPEHYREAEKLVFYAENHVPDDEPAQAAIVARAQVHATLALAAATALGREMKMHAVDAEPWMRMLSADTQWADRPTVVCLCGSTRFKDTFERVAAEQTCAGRIVLTVNEFGNDGHPEKAHLRDVSPEEKAALDELHKRKIDLADEVLVLNVGGYIGDSTRSEIAYAEKSGKPVRYLEAGLLDGVPVGGEAS